MYNKIKNIIGVDIGGTKIHFAKYSTCDLKILKEKKISTPAKEGLEKVLQIVFKNIETLKDAGTKAIGIGLPGYVDYKKNIIYRTPNIKLEKPINLTEKILKYKIPILIGNDATFFTYAEFILHKGIQCKNMVGLTLGTGLGGGIIINRKIYGGANGFAGEFGHVIDKDEKYEWEDLASGKANKKKLGKNVGIIISNILHILNPQVIALGGSVSKKELPIFMDEIWSEIKKHHFPESYQNLEIYISELKAPATLGAALSAYHNQNNA